MGHASTSGPGRAKEPKEKQPEEEEENQPLSRTKKNSHLRGDRHVNKFCNRTVSEGCLEVTAEVSFEEGMLSRPTS